MLGAVLSPYLSSVQEVNTSSMWWQSLGLHHLAHSLTGSFCLTEAGFPMVLEHSPRWPRESENSWLWAHACFLSQSRGQEPGTHQGTNSIRALLLGGVRAFHSLYLCLSTTIPRLHSPGFSSHAPCMFALWNYMWSPAHECYSLSSLF